MISEILFYGIGATALYFAYKKLKKGKCSTCPGRDSCKDFRNN